MEELLAKDEEELPMSDTKWQRRRELMAKSREQASSEEDETPQPPRPGEASWASTNSARTRCGATSRVSMRPRPPGSADCQGRPAAPERL